MRSSCTDQGLASCNGSLVDRSQAVLRCVSGTVLLCVGYCSAELRLGQPLAYFPWLPPSQESSPATVRRNQKYK